MKDGNSLERGFAKWIRIPETVFRNEAALSPSPSSEAPKTLGYHTSSTRCDGLGDSMVCGILLDQVSLRVSFQEPFDIDRRFMARGTV